MIAHRIHIISEYYNNIYDDYEWPHSTLYIIIPLNNGFYYSYSLKCMYIFFFYHPLLLLFMMFCILLFINAYNSHVSKPNDVYFYSTNNINREVSFHNILGYIQTCISRVQLLCFLSIIIFFSPDHVMFWHSFWSVIYYSAHARPTRSAITYLNI